MKRDTNGGSVWRCGLWLAWAVLAVVAPVFAEEPAPQPEGGDAAAAGDADAAAAAAKEAPGLRMDPILREAAAQFLEGVAIGEVLPTGAVSSAQDGYVVQEYRILDANAGNVGTFYRVRTLIGEPVRDVAIMFNKEGKLQDSYDLQPPQIDEDATSKANAAAAVKQAAQKPAEKPVEAGQDGAAKQDEAARNVNEVRFKSIPSSAVLGMMIGMDATTESVALSALLKGVVRAANLASGKGVAGEDVKPGTPDAFTVKPVLPEKGTAAPAFSYTTTAGKAVTADSLKGGKYAVFITSLKMLQNVTSEDALERRGAVMMSNVSRWTFANREKAAVKTRVLVVLTDKAEDVEKTKDGDQDQTEGMLASDPQALAAFGVTVAPVLLIYDEGGKLVEGFSATAPAADYLKALEELAK